MTTDERTTTDPRHMPTNTVPMRQPKERRAVARWIERRDQQGQAKDLTGYLKDVA